MNFGAKGDGTTASPAAANDTAAIQATIDAATGNADPATTGRVPTATVYLPAGVYRRSAPIKDHHCTIRVNRSPSRL